MQEPHLRRGRHRLAERFIGILVENYAGAFPAWLSPPQAIILPVSEKFHEAAMAAAQRLKAGGVRVTVDEQNQKLRGSPAEPSRPIE